MPGFETTQVKQENSRKTENSNNQVQREEKYGNEGGMLSSSISSRIQSKRGSGTPLPPSMLKDYEQKFRRNMEDVRIHQDAESNELNEQMNARAFTIGSDIFLSDSVHPSAGGRDRETLTHEMTHVVQQDGKASSGQLRLGAVDTDQEKEADSVASGESLVNFSSLDTVQRNPTDDEDEKEEKGNWSADERDSKLDIISKLLNNENKDNINNIIEEDEKDKDGEFEINTSRQKGKKQKKGRKVYSGPKQKKKFKNEDDSDEIEQSGENNLLNSLSGKGNIIKKIDKKEIKDILSDDENKREKKINPDNEKKKNRLDKYTEKKEKEKERKEIEDNYEIIDKNKAKEIKDNSNIEEMSKLPLAKELTKNQVDKKTSEKGYGIMGRIGSAFGYWALSSLLGLVSKDLASAVVGAMKESGSINEKIENAISKMPLADQNNITIINSDIDSKKKEKETEGKKLQHYRKEAKKLEKSQNMLYAKQLEAMGGQYKTQKGLEEGDFGSLNSYYKSHEKDENTYNKGMESTYEIVDKNDFQVVKQNDKAKQQNNVPVPNKNGNEKKHQRPQIKIEENENLEYQKDKNKNIISINNNNSVENNDNKIEQNNNIIQIDNNNDKYHKIEPNNNSDEENNEIINNKESSNSQSDNSMNIENENKENKINNLNNSQRIENSSESNIMSDDKSKKEKEIVQSENSGEKLNEKPENNIINTDTSNKEKKEVNDSSEKKDNLNESKDNKNLIIINDNDKEKQQGKDNKKEIKVKQDENNPNNVKKEANSKVISDKKQGPENKGKEGGSEKKKAIQKPGKKSFAETGDVEKYRETMNKVREEETKIDSLDDAIGNLRNTRTKLVKANLDEKDKETVKDQDINDYFENKSGAGMNRFLNKLFGSGKKEEKKEEPKTQVNVNINNNSDAKMETEVKKPGEKNK